MWPVPIKINPFFWLFAFLIGWLNAGNLAGALIWLVVILISVLVHESGHAISAILFKQRVRIELVAFGGLTIRTGPKLKLWQDFIVVLSGPLAGFILFLIGSLVLGQLSKEETAFRYAVEVTVTVNLIWTLLNLLPVVPLDGGRLFGIILESIFGFKGFKASLVISMILGFGFSLVAFIFGQLFIGVLFFLLGYESYRSTRFIHVMKDQDRDESIQTKLKEAQEKRALGDVQGALDLFEQIRQKTQDGMIYISASEAVGQMLAEKGSEDPQALKKAYDILYSIKDDLTESLAIFHRVAFQMKDYPLVQQMGNQAYQISPNQETALINAIANAALDDAQAAVGWLECAQRDGATHLESLLSQSEFDRIRQDRNFMNFCESVLGK